MTITQVLFSVLLIFSSVTGLANYPEGYTWDFTRMFSEKATTGLQDASNNRTWEYKWYDSASSKPSEATLMQSFHHWEKVPGWQRDGKAEHMDKICVNRVQAYSGKSGIQINWVAPINGKISVVIRAEKFQGAPAARNVFSIYKNDEKLAADGEGRYYSEVLETVEIRQGDRVAFRLITTDGWGWFDHFQFTVSLVGKGNWPGESPQR